MEMTAVLVALGFLEKVWCSFQSGAGLVVDCLYVDWCPGAAGQVNAAEGHSVPAVMV